MLSEGYIIYNGPPKYVKDYFTNFGLQMGRFSNPADKMSNIAAEPKSVLGDQMTILELNRQCKEHLAEYQRLNELAQIEMKSITNSN